MFNVGGGEVLVILLVALLVLGPGKLPQAARQIGNVLTQVRQMSSGFQNELKSAMDETVDPPAPTTKQSDSPHTTTDSDAPEAAAEGNGARADDTTASAGDDGPAHS
jgi:Tat protein translocase TatB subunit